MVYHRVTANEALNSREHSVYTTMLLHGSPAHIDTWVNILSHTFTNPVSVWTTTIYTLTKRGIIRRTARGVYSAYNETRD